MNYAAIKKNDVANGEGIRVSLFVSGCRHACKGCFNSEAWSFEYGEPYTKATEKEILSACDKAYIDGLSILGGEPFEIENQEPLLELLKGFSRRFPQKGVWCYTGFTLDEIMEGSRASTPIAKEILSYIDVLVDGKFIEKQRNLNLRFRGSANQRLIDMKKTKDINNPVLWTDDEEN